LSEGASRRGKELALVVLLAFLLSSLALRPVLAIPLLPEQVWGKVTIKGVAVLDGSVVSARIKGVEYATSTTSNGIYSLIIPGDDTDTPEKEGGVDGDVVEIYVKGYRSTEWILAGTTTFKSGEVVQLDLAIEDTTPPTVTIGPVAALTNAPTQTLNGTFRDAFIKEVRVERGGEVLAIADLPSDGVWRATISLREGLNELTVRAIDLAGNEGVASVSVVLDTTPPVISNVAVTDVTTTSARITWTTNEPSTSQVEYGTTTAYGTLTPLDPTLVTSHSVALTGLSPGTTYHFRVISIDAAGNKAYSSDFTFTTKTLPPPPPPPPPPVPPPPPKAPSSITCSVWPIEVTLGSSVVISGLISPAHSAPVTIEVSRDGVAWALLATTNSSADGSYKYAWTPQELGAYWVRASWPGDEDHEGAVSNVAVFYVTLRAFPPARAPIEKLERGASKTIDLLSIEPKLSITSITLTANETIEHATLVVEELIARPPGVPSPLHLLYKLINVTIDVEPRAIASVAIDFRVEQSWIKENEVDKAKVALLRFHRGAWEALPTSLLKEDENFAYYRALSPGLSLFAIIGEKAVPVPPPPPPPPPPPKPAELVVSNLTISPREVKPGEKVVVAATVTNLGELEGSRVLVLKVNGSVEATRNVSLAGGASTVVVFEIVKQAPAKYFVEVDGLVGSFTVRALKPPHFVVSDLSISPSEVKPGERVRMSVKVVNIGELEGSYEVVLKVAGKVVDSKTVKLAGGQSTTVEFEWVAKEAGTYEVDVAGLKGEVRVVAPPPPPGPPLALYIAVIIAIVIVAAIAVAVWRLRARAKAAKAGPEAPKT
jgi:PGF-pre-PGF domain-containing protein